MDTIKAGETIYICHSGPCRLPPGDWLAYQHVRESPGGCVWTTAIGRPSVDVSPTDPLWRDMRGRDSTSSVGLPTITAAEIPTDPGAPLCIRADVWVEVHPTNGPSYVGRLGGPGSHGPATTPQGDGEAWEALTGRAVDPAWRMMWTPQEVADFRAQARDRWETKDRWGLLIRQRWLGYRATPPTGGVYLAKCVRVESRQEAETFARAMGWHCQLHTQRGGVWHAVPDGWRAGSCA